MVTYPDSHILNVVGPFLMLTGAKYFPPERPQPYSVNVGASKAGVVPTTSGPCLTVDRSFVRSVLNLVGNVRLKASAGPFCTES
jgi:hypothetical protein